MKPKVVSQEEFNRLTAERHRIDVLNRFSKLKSESGVTESQFAFQPKYTPGPWSSVYGHLSSMLGKGMLMAIIGPRGVGKTQFGVELVRETTYNGRRAVKMNAMRLMLMVKSTFGRATGETALDIIDRLALVPLLIIDEIGKTIGSDYDSAILTELVDARYEEWPNRDTLLIGNGTQDQLKSAIGDSVMSRMHECGGIIDCTWPSFRKQ